MSVAKHDWHTQYHMAAKPHSSGVILTHLGPFSCSHTSAYIEEMLSHMKIFYKFTLANQNLGEGHDIAVSLLQF